MLDRWEDVLRNTSFPNFLTDTQKGEGSAGGSLENLGAAVAIQELLLQSHEGFLRFFPGWPLGEAASFSNFRGRGAFAVFASVDAEGVAADVSVTSEAGAPCVVLSPWAPMGFRVRDAATGAEVATRPAARAGARVFDTARGAQYELAPA